MGKHQIAFGAHCDTTQVAEFGVWLDASTHSVRTRETHVGNLLADAVMAHVRRVPNLEADLATWNGGGIRHHRTRTGGIFTAGEFTEAHMVELLPFENRVAVVKLDGRTLRQVFERSVSALPQAHGRFLQVSSEVTLVVDSNGRRQILGDEGRRVESAGSRVVSLKVSGVEVADTTMYRMATNSYLVSGNDGYSMLAALAPSRVKVLETSERAAFWEFVRGRTFEPVVEDRITFSR